MPSTMPSAGTVADDIRVQTGDTVTVMVAGKFPLDGRVHYTFPEDKTVHVLIDSPRGKWGLLVSESWLTRDSNVWQLQIP
jgi:hypothetical protein